MENLRPVVKSVAEIGWDGNVPGLLCVYKYEGFALRFPASGEIQQVKTAGGPSKKAPGFDLQAGLAADGDSSAWPHQTGDI